MPTLVHCRRLLGRVLIGALLFAHTAFAGQPCGQSAAPVLAAVSQDACESCGAKAALDHGICQRRCADIHKSAGPAGLNLPPAAVAGTVALPQAPLCLDPADIQRSPGDDSPRLSKSILFCSWLS